MKKMIKKLCKWLTWPFRKIARRIRLAKMYVKLERSYQEQLNERQLLRVQINQFLSDFFGINAKSRYIPHDFKNKEEVRVAVVDKFGQKMSKLNLQYSDLFKQ